MAFHPHVSRSVPMHAGCQLTMLYSALLGTVIFAALFFFLPREPAVDKDGSMDYIGSALGISALCLFNFAWK